MNCFTAEMPVRYDAKTRTLHWLMALLFIWIYGSAVTHNLLLDSMLDEWLWPTHKPVGLLLFVLIVIRICWSLTNLQQRPRSINKPSKLVHGLLYALMVLIPFIGLLRQYGSGREFVAFGVPVFAGFAGEKIQWMIDLGSNVHGELGWLMLALVVGHVGAVIVHYRQGNKTLIRRML